MCVYCSLRMFEAYPLKPAGELVWDYNKAMKIISVLGCGWLGLPLAERLVELGYKVKGSTTSQQRLELLAGRGIEPYLVDIGRVSDDIRRFLESPILIINIPSNNLQDYQRLLPWIEESEVEKLLFVSSTSVYSNVNQTITEQDGLETPDNPWSIIEQLLGDSPAIRTTVVRFGGLIGYGRDPARFFPPGKLIPEPEARVNMIHLDDCVTIIERIIEHKAWGETFNCCADSHPQKREFYTKMAGDAGLETPVFDETISSRYKIISSEKVKNRLDFEFRHPDLMNL